MIEESKITPDQFQALSYDERLNHWDNSGNSFLHEAIPLGNGTYLSITPNNKLERIAYNKRVIDYWRQYYFSGKHERPGNNFIYKPFEEYVLFYNNQLKSRRKGEIVDGEISRISDLIISLKTKRLLLKSVYYNLRNSNEEDIYYYKMDRTSSTLNLRL